MAGVTRGRLGHWASSSPQKHLLDRLGEVVTEVSLSYTFIKYAENGSETQAGMELSESQYIRLIKHIIERLYTEYC